MSKDALEDQKYELIKAHVLDPEHSPLREEHQQMLDRVTAAAKILDKHPIQKQAVAQLQKLYPGISRSQAYEDVRFAVRMFNTIHTFEYDFWQMWLIQDIIRNIQHCREDPYNIEKNRRVIAMEHANLIKAIGEKPTELPDPKRTEKHQFFLILNMNGQEIKVDLNNLSQLPEAAIKEVNRLIYGGNEITDIEAEEILQS